MDTSPADPALAARTVLTLLRPRASKAGADLRLHGAGVDRRVACPQETLVSALEILGAAALLDLGGKGGAVTVRITSPERGRVRIVVDDAGPGVPGPGRAAVPGSVSLVVALLSASGGTVEAGEAEGGGLRFTVGLGAAFPEGGAGSKR